MVLPEHDSPEEEELIGGPMLPPMPRSPFAQRLRDIMIEESGRSWTANATERADWPVEYIANEQTIIFQNFNQGSSRIGCLKVPEHFVMRLVRADASAADSVPLQMHCSSYQSFAHSHSWQCKPVQK